MQKSIKQFAISVRNCLSPTNSFRIDRRCVFRSKGNILSTRIRVEGPSEVVIEDGVRLRRAELLVLGASNVLHIGRGTRFSGRIELFGEGNVVTIGRDASICGTLLVAHNGRKIAIGDECTFSQETELRTTDSHKVFDADGGRINADADIFVGNRVWLGHGVAVLKGVTVGEGTVVGMRSLVTKSLPAASLAVGVPARVIKSGVSWQS